MLASTLPGACECTLRKPIPLERDLHVEASDGVQRLLDGNELIIEATGTHIDSARQNCPTFDAAERAAGNSPAFHNHPFPTCFTCGPERVEGDGLRIFPGRLASEGGESNIFAAPWIPDPSLAESNSIVRPEFVWAAMDCPTGFAAGFPWRGTLVTGRLAVEQTHLVHVGQRYVVLSWPTGNEGRKFHAGAALYGPDGELCARAKATWIKIG